MPNTTLKNNKIIKKLQRAKKQNPALQASTGTTTSGTINTPYITSLPIAGQTTPSIWTNTQYTINTPYIPSKKIRFKLEGEYACALKLKGVTSVILEDAVCGGDISVEGDTVKLTLSLSYHEGKFASDIHNYIIDGNEKEIDVVFSFSDNKDCVMETLKVSLTGYKLKVGNSSLGSYNTYIATIQEAPTMSIAYEFSGKKV